MRDVVNYEGLYGVTSCGKIWSYINNQFLTPYDNHGYKMVRLYKEGEEKSKYVHRLVGEAYIPNPQNLPEIDHIISISKGGKDNVQNLQWISKKDNIKKAVCKKIYCKELDRTFNSQKEAAAELGLDQGNISRVCRGKANTTGGYHFEFVIEEE